jgi:hypothetical protein
MAGKNSGAGRALNYGTPFTDRLQKAFAEGKDAAANDGPLNPHEVDTPEFEAWNAGGRTYDQYSNPLNGDYVEPDTGPYHPIDIDRATIYVNAQSSPLGGDYGGAINNSNVAVDGNDALVLALNKNPKYTLISTTNEPRSHHWIKAAPGGTDTNYNLRRNVASDPIISDPSEVAFYYTELKTFSGALPLMFASNATPFAFATRMQYQTPGACTVPGWNFFTMAHDPNTSAILNDGIDAAWDNFNSYNYANPMQSMKYRQDLISGSIPHDMYFAGWADKFPQKAQVVITFDDTDGSVKDAWDDVKANGLSMTFFCIGAAIGGGGGNISQAEVDAMIAEGCEFGIHGENSYADAGATALAVANAIKADKGGLQQKGVPVAPVMSWVGGDAGLDGTGSATALQCRQAAKLAGIRAARLAGANSGITRPGYSDPFYIKQIRLDEDLDNGAGNDAARLAIAKYWVDVAVSQECTIVFMGHKLASVDGTLEFNETSFTSLVEYIKTKVDAGVLDCVPFSKAGW